MKDFEQHEHLCPDCKQTWCCHETITAQQAAEDGSGFADCRWHTEVVCPSCMRKNVTGHITPTGRLRSNPSFAMPYGMSSGRLGRDIHAEVARKILGHEPTADQRREAKAITYRHLYGDPPPILDYLDFLPRKPRNRFSVDQLVEKYPRLEDVPNYPDYSSVEQYVAWSSAGYVWINNASKWAIKSWRRIVRAAVWLNNFDPEKPGAVIMVPWTWIRGWKIIWWMEAWDEKFRCRYGHPMPTTIKFFDPPPTIQWIQDEIQRHRDVIARALGVPSDLLSQPGRPQPPLKSE